MKPSVQSEIIKPRRALVSVSDKRGVLELATCLAGCGTQILSTGGTAKHLSDAGVEVTQVSDYTGFPELMGGRLKTLHPKVQGGILGREDTDREDMERHGIMPIDIVAVNLYPFESVSENPATDDATIIENIDIGGPTMIRASAKNYARTLTLVDANDYADIIKEILELGGTSIQTRRRLALKAFLRTSRYDGAIADYLSATLADAGDADVRFPPQKSFHYIKHMDMRYGENPHQSAGFYVPARGDRGWLANSTMLLGKPLSFNNVADADAAYNCVAEFTRPACVIIKHMTPCGVACRQSIQEAYELAFRTDPVSAFGGIIAFNRPLDAKTAKLIIDRQFVEVILAPKVDADALDVLRTKQNVRVFECPQVSTEEEHRMTKVTSAGGGLLLQDADQALKDDSKAQVASDRQPQEDERADLEFAWTVAKHVKSNAIVYAKDAATIGIGAGQMSRVDSARIAALKAADAGLALTGSVMASDAFFPFRDSIDTAAEHGIRAVIQPGGSMRDREVIDAANQHGMVMLLTGMRHFRH